MQWESASEGERVLYVSSAVVQEAMPAREELREAVARCFRDLRSGRVQALDKSLLNLAPGHAFQTMVAADAQSDFALVKWLGIATSAMDIVMVLSRRSTGKLLALMEGAAITGARTAAMSAIAARFLARADSRTIGFVGCGVQARSHLHALRDILPGLNRLTACSRNPESAARFVDEARALGIEASIESSARSVVEQADVLVTSASLGPGEPPFVDPRWVAPGAFVTAVDLGRSWISGSLRECFDLIVTDEHSQSAALGRVGKLPRIDRYDADLADLASGIGPGRSDTKQRALFLFAGHAVADLAAAALVYSSAIERRLGTWLPR